MPPRPQREYLHVDTVRCAYCRMLFWPPTCVSKQRYYRDIRNSPSI